MRGAEKKAVFDTNVFISAFICGRRAEEAYLLVIRTPEVRLYTSVPILSELANKLHEKFSWDEAEIKSALQHIVKVAVITRPERRVGLLDDDPDNRILECAEEAGADFIVTGDKHLLRLKEFKGTKIVTIADFLKSCKPA